MILLCPLSLSWEIYVSFGGLLMLVKGDPWSAANLKLDQRPFLIRKV
uniref:Uncharacterized protein n=1 Tax=Aegilops tauschii subsp. strangulata TaxID=200361 RepID=A0A453SQV0_AEGTS